MHDMRYWNENYHAPTNSNFRVPSFFFWRVVGAPGMIVHLYCINGFVISDLNCCTSKHLYNIWSIIHQLYGSYMWDSILNYHYRVCEITNCAAVCTFCGKIKSRIATVKCHFVLHHGHQMVPVSVEWVGKG